MLMITGPSSLDKVAKTSRQRRSTDAKPGARPEATPRAAATAGRGGRRSTDRKPDAAAQTADPREARKGDAVIGRPYAPLVAQLIAGKLGVAQTRLRRRGSVAEAAAAYRRAAAVDEDALLETEA